MFQNNQVIINGEVIQGWKLIGLQLLLGTPIPPGRYWLDYAGNWGYEGNPQIQGNIHASKAGSSRGSSSGSCGTLSDGNGSYFFTGSNGRSYFSSPSGDASID
jgi:hypothetical protein